MYFSADTIYRISPIVYRRRAQENKGLEYGRIAVKAMNLIQKYKT